ncbi:MAG: DUF169 domain-containing protein [Anaerolineae bacterium]|nr:DUF169 domain-containing protein [Anaerolineae bacterium]
MTSVQDIRMWGAKMWDILGLSGAPVGVRLLTDGERPNEAQVLEQHRYCQALMLARRGESVLLDKEGIACPAAAAAFGFRPLPAGLQSGKGLIGFGIMADEAVGRRMFEAMPRLEPGRVQGLYLFPLDQAAGAPDVVVVEDEVEKLMWISLAYLHATGGERVAGSTAVLQATCVDSTIIPYLEGRLNQGYGCYGCRDATDLGANETAMGFPAAVLPTIVAHLEYLAQKAIPTSRSKKAWQALQTRNSHQAEVE